ncbi:hypothetical protein ZIOFF_054388 [Zingiber officinale]|uniref:Dienelactone hydrolase domain-containing protein n=1 Tax=Zingiber officinale TaxID=94328 RepID=A0A8J5KJE8_ZINOF|nr:hypothetical protein ZIOFF_054388 [Zingiber officinale]
MAGAQAVRNSWLLALPQVKDAWWRTSAVLEPTRSAPPIVMVSNILEFEAPNLRKLADKVAAAGFSVVVPNFFMVIPIYLILTNLQQHWADLAGVVVVKLAKTDYVTAVVMLHPSLVTTDDISSIGRNDLTFIFKIKCPAAIHAAENDSITPPELVKQFEEILSDKIEIVDSFEKIFAGVSHGWTAPYDAADDEAAVKKVEESHQDMLDWFLKYLK